MQENPGAEGGRIASFCLSFILLKFFSTISIVFSQAGVVSIVIHRPFSDKNKPWGRPPKRTEQSPQLLIPPLSRGWDPDPILPCFADRGNKVSCFFYLWYFPPWLIWNAR